MSHTALPLDERITLYRQIIAGLHLGEKRDLTHADRWAYRGALARAAGITEIATDVRSVQLTIMQRLLRDAVERRDELLQRRISA